MKKLTIILLFLLLTGGSALGSGGGDSGGGDSGGGDGGGGDSGGGDGGGGEGGGSGGGSSGGSGASGSGTGSSSGPDGGGGEGGSRSENPSLSGNYDIGKRLFFQKLHCASCPLADLPLETQSVATIMQELTSRGDFGELLSYRQRYAVKYFLKRRFKL